MHYKIDERLVDLIMAGQIKSEQTENPVGYYYREVKAGAYRAKVRANGDIIELAFDNKSVIYSGYHDNDYHRYHVHMFQIELYKLLKTDRRLKDVE